MIPPFLKWAGGKRWLTASNQLPIPAVFDRYIEPFLGGGAVFFHLQPECAILSDINCELIDLYKVMRNQPEALHRHLLLHQANHSSQYYYQVRSTSPRSSAARAARTLYLNRTCWNGLYRVNLRGEFNVPKGTKVKVIDPEEDFRTISKALKRAEIRCADFAETVNLAKEGDFLFVDPPYTTQHNNNGFLKYNEKIFSWADQLRLRDGLVLASKRGAAIVVTNADHSSIHELYGRHFSSEVMYRPSILSGDAAYRGSVSEAIFYANVGA